MGVFFSPDVEYFDVEQGGPEWHLLRAGCITASMYGVVMDRLKSGPRAGDYTAAARSYAFKLAVERTSKELLHAERYENSAMRRGNRLEPEARLAHEIRIAMLIESTGMVRTVDGRFGASADGLIDPDGGSEYKCLVDAARIHDILLDRNIDEFMPQVQGCMWLTGRQWWHFCLYVPDLASIGKELTIFEVRRDEAYIEEMVDSLIEFDAYVERIREDLAGLPTFYPANFSPQAAEQEPEIHF